MNVPRPLPWPADWTHLLLYDRHGDLLGRVRRRGERRFEVVDMRKEDHRLSEGVPRPHEVVCDEREIRRMFRMAFEAVEVAP